MANSAAISMGVEVCVVSSCGSAGPCVGGAVPFLKDLTVLTAAALKDLHTVLTAATPGCLASLHCA